MARDGYLFRTFCLSLFLRESDIFFFFFDRIIRGFYLGELLRKAKTLKSGRPLAQMGFSVDLGAVETCREETTASNIHT